MGIPAFNQYIYGLGNEIKDVCWTREGQAFYLAVVGLIVY